MTEPTRPAAGVTVLLAVAVVLADMPQRLPFWPDAFGPAPSIGTVLLLAAVIAGIWRLGGYARDAAAGLRGSAR